MPVNPNVHLADKEVNLLQVALMLKELSDQTSDNTSTKSNKKKDFHDRIVEIEAKGKVLDVTNLKVNGKGAVATTFSEGGVRVRLDKRKNGAYHCIVYNSHKPMATDGVRHFLTLLEVPENVVEKYVEQVSSSLQLSPSARSGHVKTPLGRASPTVAPPAEKKKRGGRKTETATKSDSPKPTRGKKVRSPAVKNTADDYLDNLLA